jgi:hypothetical protein
LLLPFPLIEKIPHVPEFCHPLLTNIVHGVAPHTETLGMAV